MPSTFVARWKFCFAMAGRFSYDTEELPDFFIHRRGAQLLVATMGALDMPWLFTPNRITFLSLFAGVMSAYYATFGLQDRVYFLYAAGLELLSIILDCCDGQLARMYNSGSLVGRVLDGTADMLVAISLGLSFRHILIESEPIYTDQINLMIVFTCIAYQQQAMLFDRIKALYVARTAPIKSKTIVGLEEAAVIERDLAEAKRTSSYLSYAALVFYKYAYLGVQNSMSNTTTDDAVSSLHKLDPKEYATKWRTTMRLCTWLGTGNKAFSFYGTLFAAYFWGPKALLAFFLFCDTIAMLVFGICWFRVRQM